MNQTSIVLRTPSGLSGDMLVTGLSRLANVSDQQLSDMLDSIGLASLHGVLAVKPHIVKGISGWHAHIDLPQEHAHRTLQTILDVIDASQMQPAAKQLAAQTFIYLGKAEAKIHDIDLEKIAFHEVGALDSILDICLSAALFTQIAPANFYCSPLPVCDGVIRCEHGVLASPAPAVQEMLRGVSVYGIPSRGETITPTALAFLQAAGARFGLWPEAKLQDVVRSYGGRVLHGVPNGAIFCLVEEPAPAAASAPTITEQLFAGVSGEFRAVVESTEAGIVAGLGLLDPTLVPANAGRWQVMASEGQQVEAGTVLVEITGTAAQVGIAEDYVVGPLGFASGIATRAAVFKAACPKGLSIACGGWKKLPAALMPTLRAGLAAVGLLPRLVEGDFVYVNKNSVTLLGGIADAIRAGIAVGHGPVAVQVKTVEEALFAATTGAGVIMVDTGHLDDLGAIDQALRDANLRHAITLAFGGGVRLEDLHIAQQLGAQAVDVGRAILDAPLLDLRLRVIAQPKTITQP